MLAKNVRGLKTGAGELAETRHLAEVRPKHLAVDRFLVEPLDLRLRVGRIDVGELVDDRALLVVEEQEALLLAVLLEVLLLPLDVLAELGDRFAEELRGLLGRLVAGLDGEADELFDQGVDDVGGERGVRRDVADIDEPGLGDRDDAQAALDGEGVARDGRRRLLAGARFGRLRL